MRRSLALALPVTTLLAFAACQGADESRVPLNEGEVHEAFEEASLESGVPKDLLLALGWYESRWVHVSPEAAHLDPAGQPGGQDTADGFHGGYGVMQLSDLEGNDTLGLAAQLTEQDPELLKSDLRWNVRGAAAVLRRYADEMYEGVDVETLDLFAWKDVVARWSGAEEANDAYGVADEVFAILRDGAGRTLESGEMLELFPNEGLGDAQENDPAGTNEGGLGMAGVHFEAASSSNYTNGRGGYNVRYIVIHTMQGSYAGSIGWFKNSRAQVSAHYCIRSRDGATTQMVDENDTAWHAGNWVYNHESIGIEHEGFINDAEWYTEAMYRASARLAADIARRHHVPIDRQHIIGHIEVPGSSHTDPGPHWDWSYYMSLVRQYAGTGSGPADNPNPGGGSGGGTVRPGTGLLQGIVYTDGDASHRVAGATVKLSTGQTLTSASNGSWSIRVAAGTYTVTASKDGFRAGSVTRGLSANGSTWASTNIARGAPTAAPGRVSGVVFIAGNTSSRLAGAKISSEGKTTTTDANGRYTLELPVGRRELDITASGYLSKTLTVDIRTGQTTSINAGLSRRAQKGLIVGVVYALPNTSTRLGGARVSISNGVRTLSTTADGGGYFEFKDVDVGGWRVTASAAGFGAGSKFIHALGAQKVWGSVGLSKLGTPAAGSSIIGVIYESPNSSKRLPGAKVMLSNGTTLVADANGVYQAPAHGTISIVASVPGFAARGITRTITGRTWGSIGLTRGSPGAGGQTHVECRATATPRMRFPPRQVQLVSPLNNDDVSATPTFVFEGVGDATASYVVVLIPIENDSLKQEFKAAPGDAIRATAPRPLKVGMWSWSAYALWDDCSTTDPLDWGFFTVK